LQKCLLLNNNQNHYDEYEPNHTRSTKFIYTNC
jgi:hypothetical protein